MSGERRDRSAWAPNAPKPTASRPPIAPMSKKTRSIDFRSYSAGHCGIIGGMRRSTVVLLVLLTVGGTAVAAQLQFFDVRGPDPAIENVPYDGRFTFARLKYTTGPGGYYYHGLPAWAHGYLSCRGGSRAEESLMKIMNELSYLNPHMEESVVLAVDDPELTKYPVAYMTEAGFWTLTDTEASAFRAYLQKGGFVIFDDFRDPPRGGGGWANFEANMRRVIPGGQFVDLDPAQAIFNAFFAIGSFD